MDKSILSGPFRTLLGRMRRLAPVKTGGENAVPRRILLSILPIILFFSYYPVISLGSTDSMNLELSLPLIWLLIFSIISLPDWFSSLRQLIRARSLLLLIYLLPIYATLSILWSPNPLRALLTAGVFWCILISATSIVRLIKTFTKQQKQKLVIITLVSGLIFSLICWLQCILDVLGVTRDYTLLCAGCVYQMFGFPHPSGLAIEPQFMGNLLLAPTLLALYLLCFGNIKKRKLLITATIFLVATLFLTLSRGAIYSFAIALVVLGIIAIRKHQFRLSLVFIPIISFVITLTAQGLFAEIAPTNDNFITATTKSIHQLSLGIIDLRPPSAGELTTSTLDTSPTTQTVSTEQTSSVFDGYVAVSTDTRLGLTSLALARWLQDPATVLFGVGLGGAGTALHQSYPDAIGSPKEIVQNQYASILLELGLTGFIFACLALFILFKHIGGSPLTIVLVAAYSVTLLFFAGLPNALHIYLMPPTLYYLTKYRKKLVS